MKAAVSKTVMGVSVHRGFESLSASPRSVARRRASHPVTYYAVSAEQLTPYEQFGGEPFFKALVAWFYARVATDPVLRALYPGTDLGPAEERLRMFLEQYWSGPGTYSERRGPPRLRMRHAPFAIDRTPTIAGSGTCARRSTSRRSRPSSTRRCGPTSSRLQRTCRTGSGV